MVGRFLEICADILKMVYRRRFAEIVRDACSSFLPLKAYYSMKILDGWLMDHYEPGDRIFLFGNAIVPTSRYELYFILFLRLLSWCISSANINGNDRDGTFKYAIS